jgi:hypothetical protein
MEKSWKIPKGGNQNPLIEEEQTTQWPKEKGQTTIYKTYCHDITESLLNVWFLKSCCDNVD